ncbi:unnamed protein product [Caenorhabditis nigoni]
MLIPLFLLIFTYFIVWNYSRRCMKKRKCSRNQIVSLKLYATVSAFSLHGVVLLWQEFFGTMVFLPICYIITFLIIPCLIIFFQGLSHQSSHYCIQPEPDRLINKILPLAIVLYATLDFFPTHEANCEIGEYSDTCELFFKHIHMILFGVKSLGLWVAAGFIDYWMAKKLDIMSNGKLIGRLVNNGRGEWEQQIPAREDDD